MVVVTVQSRWISFPETGSYFAQRRKPLHSTKALRYHNHRPTLDNGQLPLEDREFHQYEEEVLPFPPIPGFRYPQPPTSSPP